MLKPKVGSINFIAIDGHGGSGKSTVEGVSALRKEFRPYISYGIFVDTPMEVCMRRGFERDKGQDDKSDQEIKQMWQDWYKKEETYIKRDNPKSSADLVINGTKPLEAQLGQF